MNRHHHPRDGGQQLVFQCPKIVKLRVEDALRRGLGPHGSGKSENPRDEGRGYIHLRQRAVDQAKSACMQGE